MPKLPNFLKLKTTDAEKVKKTLNSSPEIKEALDSSQIRRSMNSFFSDDDYSSLEKEDVKTTFETLNEKKLRGRSLKAYVRLSNNSLELYGGDAKLHKRDIPRINANISGVIKNLDEVEDLASQLKKDFLKSIEEPVKEKEIVLSMMSDSDKFKKSAQRIINGGGAKESELTDLENEFKRILNKITIDEHFKEIVDRVIGEFIESGKIDSLPIDLKKNIHNVKMLEGEIKKLELEGDPEKSIPKKRDHCEFYEKVIRSEIFKMKEQTLDELAQENNTFNPKDWTEAEKKEAVNKLIDNYLDITPKENVNDFSLFSLPTIKRKDDMIRSSLRKKLTRTFSMRSPKLK